MIGYVYLWKRKKVEDFLSSRLENFSLFFLFLSSLAILCLAWLASLRPLVEIFVSSPVTVVSTAIYQREDRLVRETSK